MNYEDINSGMPFLGGVIHQFRNWMGGIIGHSDMALCSDNPAELKEGLAIALELSEKSTELLTVLAKYKNEKPGIIGKGDLAQIGRDVRMLTDNWLMGKGLNIEEDFREASAENIDMPLTRLILIDNISRLIDYIKPGSMIKFTSGFKGGRACLGFETRIDAGKFRQDAHFEESVEYSKQCKIEIKGTGDFSLKLFY